MILIKEHKIAFLLPAKTGTTTLTKFFKNAKNAVVFESVHLLPDKALEIEPKLREYTVYSFLRNPAERFISGLLMFKEHYFIDNLINAFLKDGIADYKNFIDVNYTRNKYKLIESLFYPQARYFNGGLNVVALDFDNYEVELRRVTQGLGLDDVEIGWENESAHDSKKAMAKKVVSFVKTEYAEDCALWEAKFGRRIDA